MTQLIYGNGAIKTEFGKINGEPALLLKDTGTNRIVGTTSKEGPRTADQNEFDVVLLFKNIESARLLQDVLNEMVAEWSRDLSPKVESL